MEQSKVDQVKGWIPLQEHLRSPQVPGLHGLLLLFYPRILTDCQTPAKPHQTSNLLALG